MMCKMSSEEEELESSNICSKLQHNPWNVYLGDCSVVSNFLSNKPLLSLKWTPLHTINIFLRAVGQVSDSCLLCQDCLEIFSLSASFREQPPARSHHLGWYLLV